MTSPSGAPACASCGAALRPGARFCPSCGEPAPPARTTGDPTTLDPHEPAPAPTPGPEWHPVPGRPGVVVGLRGGAEGRAFLLPEGDAVLGRDAACTVVLDDDTVSRRHAEMVATDRGWRIRDLGSSNGTRINGERVAEGDLTDGDLLGLGRVVLLVRELASRVPVDAVTSGEAQPRDR